MRYAMFMQIDCFQFYKRTLTNLVFRGELKDVCNEFIDCQTKLAKQLVTTYTP